MDLFAGSLSLTGELEGIAIFSLISFPPGRKNRNAFQLKEIQTLITNFYVKWRTVKINFRQLVSCVLSAILFTTCSKDSDATAMVILSFDGKTISFRHNPASGQEVYLQRIQSGHQVVAKKTGSDDAISVAVFQQDPRQPPWRFRL